MKAVFCEKLGSPDDLVIRDVESPTPGEGDVKVSLKAHGVSYVDLLLIAGQYQVKHDLPFIPGSEATGVVTEVGSGVETVEPGARVLCTAGFTVSTPEPASWSRSRRRRVWWTVGRFRLGPMRLTWRLP